MKFSIRDLLLVTVIVALALGWWLDRSRLNNDSEDWKFRAESAAAELDGFGYKIEWANGVTFEINPPTDKYIRNPHWDEPVTRSSIHGHSALPTSQAPAPKSTQAVAP